MLPSVTVADIRLAMERFDGELRDTPTWKNWEKDRRYKFGIEEDGWRYPVKQIVSMATNAPLNSFGGGTEANGYVEKLGFTIVSMQMPTESEVQIALHELLISRRPEGVPTAEAYAILADVFHLPPGIRSVTMDNGEKHWENRVRFARRKLVAAGLMDSAERGVYKLATRSERRVWLEKTLVEGRPDKLSGPYAMGRALWSPQRDRADADIYAPMRQVQPGDPVIHLIDNQRITGVSIVDGYVNMEFTAPENSEWSGAKCYVVPLREFRRCEPPLERKAFLNDIYAPRLRQIRKDFQNLFYDRDLNLVQGAYITVVPPELSVILDSAYRAEAKKPLPHIGDDARPDEVAHLPARTHEANHLNDAEQRVWTYSPGQNAEYWDQFYADGIMAIGWNDLGDLSAFDDQDSIKEQLKELSGSSSDPMNDSLACFEFVNSVKPGDLVFAKRGRSRIIGYGTVLGDYVYDPARANHKNIRSIRWDARGDWPLEQKLATKALTEITWDEKRVNDLKRLVGLASEEEAPKAVPLTERQPYSVADAMDGLFMPQEELEKILRIWQAKKNLILQGPPGVGKTHMAKRLGYALMGFQDPSRVNMVQFHQSYSYEDFVQGYRPAKEGLKLRDGLFLEFCAKASRDLDTKHVFIIDEINRGNLSRIFGELMMLIEPDKRGNKWSVPLTYAESSEAQFSVPNNIYLLGLMNTADRSLAMVDYALRRRFAFWTIEPRIDTDGFRSMLTTKGVSAQQMKRLIDLLTEINAAISDDTANLGRGYRIGHSLFCQDIASGTVASVWLADIIETELVPLVTEYWVDDTSQADQWIKQLRDVV